MHGRIILGYDGSEQSHDALALGRLIAAQGDRTVVVTHVVPHPPPYDARTREYVTLVRHHDHSVLDPALAALADLRVEGRPIESPSPARGLHEVAAEEGASLIVIGSTHRGPVGRVLVGSVGELLLAGTPAAVAVAPKGFASRAPSAIGSVTAGFSRTLEGHAALRAAATLAAELRAKLRAVAVEETFIHARHAHSSHVHEGPSLEEELERAIADVQAPDAERVVLTGGVAERLAEQCAGTDLLVVGSRSYGPFHHTLLGSVSAKLMRSCPAPLMVVPRGAELPGVHTAATAAEPARGGS
jgi:nucleotide-binding universal stress UspA family protein